MDWLDNLDPNTLRILALAYWLTLAFALGAVVGSFINVAAARLPAEKSLVWPASRCGLCFQPIRWYDNIPLVSFLWLRGRCRSCGGRFSSRYLWVELATALGFAGLFYVEVIQNVHGWPLPRPWIAMPPWQWLIGFAYHATLLSFLLAASVCDLKSREIPLGLTITGTIVGLIGATLLPWPWPWTPLEAMPASRPGFFVNLGWQGGAIREGIYPWPFWGPLPAWSAPGGNWITGLATGLAGALAGTFLMRAVGFLFSTGLGKEAMGLGDADLMMMAGAFLGSQVIVIGFMLSAFPALVFGVIRWIVYRDNALPFGPSLSVGVLGTYLVWHAVGPYIQQFFFHGIIMLCLVGAAAGILLAMAFMFRLVRQ